MAEQVLVLGIGNSLMTDDGVGVRLVEYLEQHHPQPGRVRYLDGGTLSFTLAEAVAEHPCLIVLDAARSDGRPGTVYCFEDDAMDRHLASARGSVHEVGLRDLLDIAALTDRFPRHRALVGVEPKEVDWGEELSGPVQAALPEAARRVLGLIEAWG